MGTSSWLATWADWDFLVNGSKVRIANPILPGDRPLPARAGIEVAAELGGRKLFHYMIKRNLGRYRFGATTEVLATPTAYSPEEVGAWLILPGEHKRAVTGRAAAPAPPPRR